MAAATKPRLREIYEQEVAPALREKFEFSSPMQVPKPVKVVINMGLGKSFNNPKIMENAVEELGIITGQKAVPTRSSLFTKAIRGTRNLSAFAAGSSGAASYGCRLFHERDPESFLSGRAYGGPASGNAAADD